MFSRFVKKSKRACPGRDGQAELTGTASKQLAVRSGSAEIGDRVKLHVQCVGQSEVCQSSEVVVVVAAASASRTVAKCENSISEAATVPRPDEHFR